MNRRQFTATLLGTAAVQLAIALMDLAQLRTHDRFRATTAMADCDTCGMEWPLNKMRASGRLLVCNRNYCRALADSFFQTISYSEMINGARMDVTSLKWADFDVSVDGKVA